MQKPEILVIDDEIEVGTFFQYLLEDKGYHVTIATSGKEAVALINNRTFDLAIVDLKLQDADGISLLTDIKKHQASCEVIIITGYSTLKSAVEAIKLGAFDYIDKPFEDIDELEKIIERALGIFGNEPGNDELDSMALQFGIVSSPESPMRDTLEIAKKIASKNISVLLDGETGTGKELLARYIHFNSVRADNIFFAFNCGVFTETLLESELFGHEKGAFTGAERVRRGIFEIADGGTLFLDEIASASPAIQVKLLRVLETREFMRVGGENTHKTDIRIIVATNTDLKDAVSKGMFREDLFYRLDVVTLNLPPLRDRICDIPLLVKYFTEKNVGEKEKESNSVRFCSSAMELLKAYIWPGNVRELANVVIRAVALRDGNEISVGDLPGKITGGKSDVRQYGNNSAVNDLSTLMEWWSGLLPPLLDKLSELNLTELQGKFKEVEADILRSAITGFMAKEKLTYEDVALKMGVTPRVLRYLLKEKK